MIIDFVKKIPGFIFKYKFTILCLLYFCIISILATYSNLEGRISKPAIATALSFFFILNIIAKMKYSSIFSVVFAILISIDSYFAFVYSTSITSGILGSIFETNAAEAKEVLTDALFKAIIILGITLLLIFQSKKELKPINFSIKKSLAVFLIYSCLFIPGILYRKITINEVRMGDFAMFPLNTVQLLTAQHFPLIYNDCVTYLVYRDEMSKLNSYKTSERVLPEGIVLENTELAPEKIYYIIGESSWRNHYSLYGYSKKTTPFLDSLNAASPNNIKYYDGIAPAPFTRDATRILLSFATPTDINPFFREKSIIDLAHHAGYETLWISNQAQLDFNGSYIGYVAMNANYNFFNTKTSENDLDLLPVIADRKKQGKKQFIIIHLTGSHLSYSERFDEIDVAAIAGGNDQITQYDRTIHHTDRVLRGIYNEMQKDSCSVLYYIPDHSEIIGLGHGFPNQGTSQFEVPIIVINNKAAEIETIVDKYIDPETSLINGSSSIYILSEYLGYSVSKENVEKSIIDGRYILHGDGKIYKYDTVK
ncbi:sulfatase-like hydrolase/transferase [Dysgonomonas sp. ZJ279]|uniref:sulfatase-like hydrolase/transferase n=1 Tax=Dysgonomonas sp. ZJ279 TaxID=2709796 RepID=UPI0021066003|nr:sulfatase-like hydrolase/transferase [Dysgonomonas sp. ZJ279]